MKPPEYVGLVVKSPVVGNTAAIFLTPYKSLTLL